MSTQGRPRREWIDGVKGLAILWIVLFHTFKEWDVADSTSAAWTVFSTVIRLAYHSVGVFFVMSGIGILARVPAETEERLFAPSTLAAGLVVFVVGVMTSRSIATYAVTDALAGSGLFLILAHAARFLLERAPAIGWHVVTVGTFSYGLYLLHQPYMITLGTAMQGYGALAFFAAAAVVIATLAIVTMQIERAMNTAVAKVLA